MVVIDKLMRFYLIIVLVLAGLHTGQCETIGSTGIDVAVGDTRIFLGVAFDKNMYSLAASSSGIRYSDPEATEI